MKTSLIPFGRLLVLCSCLCLLTVLGCKKETVQSDPASATADLQGGTLVFEDDFERAELGEHWSAQGSGWRIENGAVTGQNARNDALWLDFELPEKVRVEFDATAVSQDGDLKFELFGDGTNHESGYILIYGGWSNTVTCIARQDEHGSDRLDAEHHDPVQTGTTYRFAAVRIDQRVQWFIDGQLVLVFDDSEPLTGQQHAHLGFNDWTAPVRFDNLAIYDLQ